MSETSERIRVEWAVGDAQRDKGLTTPDDIVRVDDISYGPYGRENVMDLYRRKEDVAAGISLPVIISIHGGGYVYGDKELYQFYCMSLAQRGFAVLNFTYRLAPENRFPACLEDTNRVFEWAVAHASEYNLDMNNVFLLGDSAGGHMAALYTCVWTNPEYASLVGIEPPLGAEIRAVAYNCSVYFPFDNWDIDKNRDDFMSDLFGTKDYKDEAEKYLIVADHVKKEGFPPVYVMTSEFDFLRGQAEPFKKALDEKGIENVMKVYSNPDVSLYHVFHLDVRAKDGIKCNDEECEFFRKYMV